jgi:hypothetical protein
MDVSETLASNAIAELFSLSVVVSTAALLGCCCPLDIIYTGIIVIYKIGFISV